ncbi:SACOL1771 family peroxiredoxin [Bacillus sp. AGMB 02131]|uniref:SACOL1771 family peroxiredoxin n=1 Tax=Peribacillus faecalis TaxID=2772559 RepID=A0A927CWB9_9BACI|nr:SACOL1771 family peroxiredoxin [Peribacillus faecalis]MBD3107952.1 SACOL1771 family peroxiredoxin [Peribacillus faecalis]
MAEHRFHLKAHWPHSSKEAGNIEAGNLVTQISIPAEMNGPGIGTNPDEMLLGAASTCYIITLAVMLEYKKLEKVDLTMESEGIVEVSAGGTPTYKKIIHRPLLTLKSDATDEDIAIAHKLAAKAEGSCMISRALKGNVDITSEITVIRA